jgi:hypothetical protein
MVQSILIIIGSVLFVIALSGLLGRLMAPKPDRSVAWDDSFIHALDVDQFTVISEMVSTADSNFITSVLYLGDIQYDKDRETLRLRMRRRFFYSRRTWFSNDFKWAKDSKDFFLLISNVKDWQIIHEKTLDPAGVLRLSEMSLPHVTISHNPVSRNILITDAIENFRSFSIEVTYGKLDVILTLETL